MLDTATMAPPKPAPHKPRSRPRATAETMAAKQRDISVSEFFAKNRHLLGFDNPRKALLTTVKEAVDNSLDACEEAGILPDITVVIEELDENGKAAKRQSGKEEQPEDAAKKKGKAAQSARYRVTVVDNGPGIVRKQVEHIFGRLLYGSKFHRLKMSRGQQGIGISAAGMYGLLTTGRPMAIQTRPHAGKKAHHIELAMNTKTNRAEVTTDEETDDFPLARLRNLTPGIRELAATHEFLSPGDYPTGTSVTIELEARYQKGRGSVDEFLELTAIANPHAKITFVPPAKFTAEDGESAEDDSLEFSKTSARTPAPSPVDAQSPAALSASSALSAVNPAVKTQEREGVTIFPRAVAELPPETKEIQPHPRGVELGALLQMMKDAESERDNYSLYAFLQDKFSRVSAATASTLCQAIGVTSRTKVSDIDHTLGEKLFRELQEAKLPPPPTDCLAPIGVRQLLAGLLKGVRAEFYAASTRDAAVYRGRPFQIEAALAFGGDLPADEPARVIRFANRVPLLYQQSACSSFKAVIDTNWRNYDLQQPRGSAPVGPLIVMIHMASVWVPFTSESKEAIADYDEIRKEMRLALMECGRKLGAYVKKRQKMKREGERRDIFERYIGEIAKACEAISGADANKLYDALLHQARRRTAIADAQLDEDGRVVKEKDEPAEEGVIIVDQTAPAPEAAPPPIAAATGTQGPAKTERVRGTRERKAAPTRRSPPLSLAPRVTSPPPGGGKSAVAAPGPAPQPKPKMRLVNGKLIPIEDAPRLF